MKRFSDFKLHGEFEMERLSSIAHKKCSCAVERLSVCRMRGELAVEKLSSDSEKEA